MNTLALAATPARPLSSLPGPTGLPLLGHAHRIRPLRMHLQLEQWARQYGDCYRFDLGRFKGMVCTDPAAAQAALRDRPEGMARAALFRPVFRELGIDGLFSTEGDDWLPQRRLIMASLGTNRFRSFFPTIQAVTGRLQRRWQAAAQAGTVLEMTRELMRYTVDVTSALSFGEDPNTIDDTGNVIQDHLASIFPAIMRRTISPVPYWHWFKLPADRRLDRDVAAVHAYARERIARARARLASQPDAAPDNVLEGMVQLVDQPGSGFTDELVVANVLTLLLGGEDTTAHSLAWTMWYLAQDPALQRRMHEAAVAAWPADAPVCGEHDAVRGLEAFEALATEAIRLRPVAPMLGLQALRDTVVSGIAVPAGTHLYFLCRPAQIAAEHFGDPLSYRPERWLHADQPDDGKTAWVHNPRAFLQFGAGPRVCPGRHLAGVEVRMVLSMLLRHFELELACSPDEIEEVQHFTVAPSHMPVRLKPRRTMPPGAVAQPSRQQPAAPAGRCPFGHG